MFSLKLSSRRCRHRLVTDRPDDSPFIVHLPVPYNPPSRPITPVHFQDRHVPALGHPFLSLLHPHNPCRPDTQAWRR